MNPEEKEEIRNRIQQAIDGLFNMLDEDENGYIDKDELRDKMEEGFEPLPTNASNGLSKEA